MELKLEQVVIRDDELVVFFPLDAIVEGELVVAPIHSFKSFNDLPDSLVEKMFHVVHKMSSSLFDILKCHGTNLLIQDGSFAGQVSDSLFIRIIPRFEGDSLALNWSSNQASPEDLDGLVKSFKNFDDDLVKEEHFELEKKRVEESNKPDSIDGDKDNYLLKSLRRNP
jgi:histidine triad (HIT) family protein